MRYLLLGILAVSGVIVGSGCKSSEPDEKQLHQMLGQPPHRPKSQGVGQKKLEHQTPPSTPESGTSPG